MGLPWSTTFPATKQCKHWRDAHAAALHFYEQIKFAAQNKASKRPHGDTMDQTKPSKRDTLLIDAATSAPMYIFPAANANQARLLAKGSLLVAIHDDDVDCQNYGPGMNLLKEALEELQFLPDEPEKFRGPWKNPLFQDWVDDCVQENDAAGLQSVQGVLIWAKYTVHNQPQGKEYFASWSDYVQFRIEDFTTVAISGMLQLSCSIAVPEPERKPLDEMYQLYMMHLSLTNDLYSYDNEMLEAKKEVSAISNGAPVLARLLNVSERTAKVILRLILIDLEDKLHLTYNTHVQSNKLNDRQLRYTRSMIEGLAGNLFFSATSPRYARAVPGSRIHTCVK